MRNDFLTSLCLRYQEWRERKQLTSEQWRKVWAADVIREQNKTLAREDRQCDANVSVPRPRLVGRQQKVS